MAVDAYETYLLFDLGHPWMCLIFGIRDSRIHQM
jgi:hypothetical protein